MSQREYRRGPVTLRGRQVPTTTTGSVPPVPDVELEGELISEEDVETASPDDVRVVARE